MWALPDPGRKRPGLIEARRLSTGCSGRRSPTPGGNARASLKRGRRRGRRVPGLEPTPGGNARASLKQGSPAPRLDVSRRTDPGRKRPGLIEAGLASLVQARHARPTPGGNARASLKRRHALDAGEHVAQPTPGGNARASLKRLDAVHRQPDEPRRPRAETPGPH